MTDRSMSRQPSVQLIDRALGNRTGDRGATHGDLGPQCGVGTVQPWLGDDGFERPRRHAGAGLGDQCLSDDPAEG